MATKGPTIMRDGRLGGSSVDGKDMGTFTGQVYLDPILRADQISYVNVNFTPCARTHWHRHEHGQLLKVTGGSGWVCNKGQEPERIGAGDVVWCPPGGVHWHGADEKSFLVHEAISYGKIDWLDAVDDAAYANKET